MIKRWLRFTRNGATEFGLLSQDGLTVAIHTGELLGENHASGTTVLLSEVTLMAPVAPSKFLGLWNNYHELATKLGQAVPPEPLYFVKTPNSYLPPAGVIRAPRGYTGKVFYEGELGIVIGRRCKDATEADAAESIFGFTCVNDVTALDILQRDASFAQWARAKSCDTFGPIGPVIAQGLDWKELRVKSLLNGRERQNYPCSDMIHSPAQIVSALSQEMTLEPGDVIASGTSVGALPMKSGATIEIEITGIGILKNTYLAYEEHQP